MEIQTYPDGTIAPSDRIPFVANPGTEPTLKLALASTFVGPQGEAGTTGSAGPPGVNGRTVLSGPGAPDPSDGTDGDFWLDTDETELYGPKTAGDWGDAIHLIGNDGADGPPGPSTGPAGGVLSGTYPDPGFAVDMVTQAELDAAVAAVIDSAPGALDTLNELAAALGDDANYAATVTTALAGKAGLAGAVYTGPVQVVAPTTADSLAELLAAASASTRKPLVVQGKASQTANLVEWQSSAGAVLGSIAPSGGIAVGSTALGDMLFRVQATTLAGIPTKHGAFIAPTFDSTSTGTISVVTSQPATAASAFTASNLYGFRVLDAILGAGSAITNQYGMFVAAQTKGASNYGIAVAAASTQTLWVGHLADSTTAAAGIAFGLSRDTTLSRSAAGVLATNGALAVGTNPAQSGALRLASGASVNMRNAANTADMPILSASGASVVLGGLSNDNLYLQAGAANVISIVGATLGYWNDGLNWELGTGTGSKIGTAANQKIGKWGASPRAQPSGWGTPSGTLTRTTFDPATATLAEGLQRLAALITDLKSCGNIGA